MHRLILVIYCLLWSDELPYNAASCTQTCNYLWDGFGRWTNKKWRPYLEGT